MLKWVVRICIAISATGVVSASNAQTACPQNSAANLIADLQGGTVKAQFLSPSVWQNILYQSGGSGYFPQLAQLGPIIGISNIGYQPLPNGQVCGFLVQFNNAQMVWQIAFAFGLVQGVNFNTVGSPGPTGGTTPSPPQPPTRSDPVPDPGDSCKLYPNLC